MMEIKDIMNKDVITLSPEMTIKDAYELFVKNHISGAPVVDPHGKLLGILTTKDILKIIKNRMEDIGIYVFPTPFDFMEVLPIEIPEESKATFESIANTKVGEIMERRVHYVNPDTDIYEALELLVKKGISRLPVVNENKKVVGIITRSDVLKALAKSNEIP
ncbi:putative signal transduction protein with CBS domains [Aciduliprofundum boonei T469]|uniref:Signal transduction protein with CBS domains n=2 Tax=Candidatus Aciduliprofundum boonei TaxID=379547 RepID=D3TAI7_ACIB4|nr:putative signal transduction protein with CBS domains [Aciduliprofundum boonei T469]HII55368.1 CBS domain-containing protein [Candidatus Aciduliprofundum boonei]